MKTNHNQIVFAREYRGYSQTELACKIKGLSQSKLSKIEKGIEPITTEILWEISKFLNFPIDFFSLDIHNKVFSAQYRKKRISQRKKSELDMRLKTYGYLVDRMSKDYIEYPSIGFPQVDIADGFSPQSVAKQIRRIFGLKDDPVKDIFTLLENNGIVIIEDDSDLDEFDGVSFVSDNGNLIIIVNKNMPNDRKRFTVAHEFGHLIMHNIEKGNYLIDDNRDIEKEANAFASEFLMPEDGIRNQLKDLRLSDLGALKQYWLTSMASIIYRAKDLKCIDENKAQYFNIEFSRKGYRKQEPIVVPIDVPSLFYKSFIIIKDALNYTIEEMSSMFCLSVEDIEELFSLRRKQLKMKVLF